MTSLWRNDDVIFQINYTKLISLGFSTTLPNFISIPWKVLVLLAACTFRLSPPPAQALKKPGPDRVKRKYLMRIRANYVVDKYMNCKGLKPNFPILGGFLPSNVLNVWRLQQICWVLPSQTWEELWCYWRFVSCIHFNSTCFCRQPYKNNKAQNRINFTNWSLVNFLSV